MARWMKLSDELIEQIRALTAAGLPKNAVAKKLGVSASSVDKYAERMKEPARLQALRDVKKRLFIEKAWENIELAIDVGNARLRLAQAAAAEFRATVDRFVELLEAAGEKRSEGGAGPAPSELGEVVKALATVLNVPLNHLTGFVGTLYDRQAAAAGEVRAYEREKLKIELEKLTLERRKAGLDDAADEDKSQGVVILPERMPEDRTVPPEEGTSGEQSDSA